MNILRERATCAKSVTRPNLPHLDLSQLKSTPKPPTSLFLSVHGIVTARLHLHPRPRTISQITNHITAYLKLAHRQASSFALTAPLDKHLYKTNQSNRMLRPISQDMHMPWRQACRISTLGQRTKPASSNKHIRSVIGNLRLSLFPVILAVLEPNASRKLHASKYS